MKKSIVVLIIATILALLALASGLLDIATVEVASQDNTLLNKSSSVVYSTVLSIYPKTDPNRSTKQPSSAGKLIGSYSGRQFFRFVLQKYRLSIEDQRFYFACKKLWLINQKQIC